MEWKTFWACKLQVIKHNLKIPNTPESTWS